VIFCIWLSDVLTAAHRTLSGIFFAKVRFQVEIEPAQEHRSLCPINLALEVFGDKWTLLIIRDMMFGGKRHFREMLKSEEHIASNILADRLTKLVKAGILTRTGDTASANRSHPN